MTWGPFSTKWQFKLAQITQVVKILTKNINDSKDLPMDIRQTWIRR